MSPEIINGHDFDLPTDVFSLGIIFVEILSRKLVDSKTYTVSLTWRCTYGIA
jgi:LIM domain kinase 1